MSAPADGLRADAAAADVDLGAEEFPFARGEGNKIAVSNSKTASAPPSRHPRCRAHPSAHLALPAGFFANLTKRFFRSHEEVELSALENAIAVAVDTGASPTAAGPVATPTRGPTRPARS